MFKRKIFFSAIIITAVILIIGCSTTSTIIDSKDTPEWVRSWSGDAEYFIGIGFSNTGNEANDITNARVNAFSDLGAVIFDNIKRSQQHLHLLPADAEEKYFGAAEAHIVQALSRNHIDIKSDSYSENENGYWVCYKILKTDWERIQKEEQQEIAEFLHEVLSPRLLSRDITTFELLTFLANGWKFIADSPYPALIRGRLNNEEGLLIALIESNIYRIISGLTINIATDNIATELGRSEDFIISVSDIERRNPGSLPIGVFRKANNRKIAEVTTAENGRYSGKIEFRNIPPGRQQLYAQILMPHILENIRDEEMLPSREFAVTINPVRVVLMLIVNGEAEIGDFIDRTKALFSKEELALRLSPGGRDEVYTIHFTINFMNQPGNLHNLFITNANATVEVLKEGNVIFSYAGREYREVGVNMSIAQERVAVKMFNDLNRDELFFRELQRAMYGRNIFE